MDKWGFRNQWHPSLGSGVNEWIIIQTRMLWERPPLDKINVLNSVIEVDKCLNDDGTMNRSYQPLPHSPEWRSTVPLPILFDPTKKCPEIDAFFKAVLPQDAYEAGVGYQVPAWLKIPNVRPQKALMALGGDGTGKSIFLALNKTFLGKQNTSHLALHSIEENRFMGPALIGKLANVFADLSSRDLASTSLFKSITSGIDTIQVEHKGVGAPFPLLPLCRLVFSANKFPKPKEPEDPFYKRWWVIPFDNRGIAR